MPAYETFDPAKEETLDAQLDRLGAEADILVVDTPGRDDPHARAAMVRADTLVTPINDSFVDLDLIGQVDPDTYRVRRPSFYAELKRLLPEVEIVEVPAGAVSLEDAIRSYLFNAQLVTLPAGGMALILPEEARETPSVWIWLEAMVAGNGPIRELFVVDVRQSMANGGGPACLRLRVVAEPEAVDPRFMVDEEKLDRLAAVVDAEWPERIEPEDLLDPPLWTRMDGARAALLGTLGLEELI